MLHKFATFVAACTILLILAGSLVTSNGAGLSVPDWPTSYGWNMFTFPPSMWVANILYEHGHRLIASSVGFLTIILAVWVWVAEPRRWLRWLTVGALGAVVAQGILGGLTVLFFLPAPISTAHAGLAEIFFCMVVSIALFTSRGWIEGYSPRSPGGSRSFAEAGSRSVASERSAKFRPSEGIAGIRRIATLTTVAIYTQILVGATMRHTGAGLAIPDFPLMLGHLVPPRWNAGIAIHFAHRLGALCVVLAVSAACRSVWTRERNRKELTRPAAMLAALVAAQVTLGAFTVLSRLNPWINSTHVVCGALVLTTSLVLTLRSWRARFPEALAGFENLPHGARARAASPTRVLDRARA